MPGAATEQEVTAAELAVFAQDRWRIGSRVTLELGLRLDREDIIQRVNWSPRGGMTVDVCPRAGEFLGAVSDDSGNERRLNVGAFGQFESARSRALEPMGLRWVVRDARERSSV